MKQYQVTGMSCAACQARVEKAVSKVPGVESVAVSLLTNSMGVEGPATPEEVIEAVVKAGYGASLRQEGTHARSGMHSDNSASSRESSSMPSEDILKDTETPKLVRRLILSAAFLLVLMYVSMGHNMWGFPLPSYFHHNYLGLSLLQMLLAIVVMLINRKFFENGFRSVLHGAPNMDTLVALGSGVSFAWSLWVVFSMCGKIAQGMPNMDLADIYHDQLYFESAAMIPALITVGKTLESLSKGRTTNALKSLIKLAPKTARILSEKTPGSGEYIETVVPIENVKVGDIFAVKPGESIPVDGVVEDGESAVDESALTGESVPVDKIPGQTVSAATMNRSGYLRCRATRVGEDTTLAQIIQMVSDAAATKAPIARIADKVSGIFVPAVIGIALLVIVIWLISGQQLSFALARGISVLVISCPCALGLATPVAIMVGNGLGAKNGVLFKTGASLESTGRADIVALDKTGTITSGKPHVTRIIPCDGVTEEELLAKAYALEKRSEHPLARAIVEKYESDRQTSSEALEVSGFSIHAGHGLEGYLDQKLLHGGNGEYIQGIAPIPQQIKNLASVSASDGETPLFFAEEERLLGMIGVADQIKSDSSEGIRQLKNLGLRVVMLTGDNAGTANAIAREADVDYVVAGVLPDGKSDAVRKLQEYGKVIMVGDGINDAPALTSADIGIAIGAGTDVAIDSADVVLMNNSLVDVAAAVRLSRKTLRNIHENLFWAFFYNAICIPIAAGVLSWKMHPMIGAAAMSLSSFTVCMNALRLNLFKMRDPSHDKAHHGKSVTELPFPRPERERKEEVPLTGMAPETIQFPEGKERSSSMRKTLKIEGMMCGHCEATVKKALEALDFIASASPDHSSNTCPIELVDGKEFDEAKVREVIEDKDFKYIGVD